MSQEDTPQDDRSRIEKVKQHLKENKERYLAAAGGAVIGGTVVGIVTLRRTGFPLEISQVAKNQALINWKPEINQIALVRKACPDPIPVLDKVTGEVYSSIRRAVKVTGETMSAISKDAHGDQIRWERLPDSVFA